MKNTLLTALLLLVSLMATAQTTSVVADRIRAAEFLRVGNNSSQKITGFSTTIPAIPTDFTLPTTKALKDYVVASFQPLNQAASGDLGGTYPSPTVVGIRGIPVSATTPTIGQVLKYNGTSYVPSNDNNTTYSAGAGVAISGGNVISNTAPNVVQELSIAGQDLTLSGGGGTVAIPAGASDALGTGFTSGGGTGTIPDGTVATAQGNFSILGADQTVDDGGNISIIPSNSEDGNGGGLILKSGSSTNGSGGKLTFTAGSGIVGGGFSMFGGQSNGLGEEGGPAALNGGESTNGGKGGDVSLAAGSGTTNGKIILNSWGVDFIGIDLATRDLISSPVQGTTIFCTDATANDSSTGVMQVYNGSVWKNAW